jgi:methanogenic corrinoid protein MtbC1
MMGNRHVRRALYEQRVPLAEQIVTRHYELEPDSWRPYGSVGRAKCVQDAEYHLMYLAEAIGVSSPAIFLDYVAWLKVLFCGLGFADRTVEVTLGCARDVIRNALPPDAARVAGEYLEMAVEEAGRTPVEVPSFLESLSPLAALARQYLEALLRGDRRLAIQLILQAAEDGADVRDIYVHAFQACQYEIGRLWQLNQISVAQEHFCTAATQLAMAQLYPRIFSTHKNGRRLVATCVSGELHEIGARMVADLFEIEGWDTYYLGANTPAASIVEVLAEQTPDVLAVSATMMFHVGVVADLVAQVRAADGVQKVVVMVGGYPFNVAPDLWRRVGADATARDALDAIAVAERLVGEVASQ